MKGPNQHVCKFMLTRNQIAKPLKDPLAGHLELVRAQRLLEGLLALHVRISQILIECHQVMCRRQFAFALWHVQRQRQVNRSGIRDVWAICIQKVLKCLPYSILEWSSALFPLLYGRLRWFGLGYLARHQQAIMPLDKLPDFAIPPKRSPHGLSGISSENIRNVRYVPGVSMRLSRKTRDLYV